MSSASYVIPLVLAGITGGGVWYSLNASTESPKAYLNDTGENVSVPLPQQVLSTKAWLFDPMTAPYENQTVLEFDPETKSFTELELPGIDSKRNKGVSAQNDNFGAFLYEESFIRRISLFDKKEKKVIALANLGSSYDYINLGISGEHALLLSETSQDDCQSADLLSVRENIVIQSNMTMKVCRIAAYCMCSMRTGDIYVLGGYTMSGEATLRSEKYIAETKSFEAIADLPNLMKDSAKPYCRTAEYNNGVMVCDNNADPAHVCYMYDPESNSWETVGGFVKDRRNYELVVIGNDLFAIGGSGVDSIEKYNRETKSWEVFMSDINDFENASEFYAFSI